MGKQRNTQKRKDKNPGREREEELLAPRPWDGQTPPPISKHETRDLKDGDLHRRIGPAVPVDNDDWY